MVSLIGSGANSAEALKKVYGQSVDQIDKELRAYLSGNFFQGELVPAKIGKVSGEAAAEPQAGEPSGA